MRSNAAPRISGSCGARRGTATAHMPNGSVKRAAAKNHRWGLRLGTPRRGSSPAAAAQSARVSRCSCRAAWVRRRRRRRAVKENSATESGFWMVQTGSHWICGTVKTRRSPPSVTRLRPLMVVREGCATQCLGRGPKPTPNWSAFVETSSRRNFSGALARFPANQSRRACLRTASISRAWPPGRLAPAWAAGRAAQWTGERGPRARGCVP